MWLLRLPMKLSMKRSFPGGGVPLDEGLKGENESLTATF